MRSPPNKYSGHVVTHLNGRTYTTVMDAWRADRTGARTGAHQLLLESEELAKEQGDDGDQMKPELYILCDRH
jgi:hypothetical protein